MNPMTRTALGDALAAGAAMPFHEAARLLLNCLGYRSDRTIEGQTGHVGDLPEAFRVNERTTQSAQAFKDEALSAHVIFQVGGERDPGLSAGASAEDGGWFDAEFTKSFCLLAVELRARETLLADALSHSSLGKRTGLWHMPGKFVLFPRDRHRAI